VKSNLHICIAHFAKNEYEGPQRLTNPPSKVTLILMHYVIVCTEMEIRLQLS